MEPDNSDTIQQAFHLSLVQMEQIEKPWIDWTCQLNELYHLYMMIHIKKIPLDSGSHSSEEWRANVVKTVYM